MSCPYIMYTLEKMNTVRDLGFRVREFRKTQQLSLSEAAALCGVGIRFLSEFENGKDSIHFGKALHVVHKLGLEIRLDNRLNNFKGGR